MKTADLERAAQEARADAERRGEPFPPYVRLPVGPKPPEHREPVVDRFAGTVLANVEMQPRDAARTCSPLGAVFGFTKPYPHGQVADGWSWRIRWGLGRRDHDGALTESVALRFEHPVKGFLLWAWTRTPANVVALVALRRYLAVHALGGFTAPSWPLVAALLPSTKWAAMAVLEWRALEGKRITQPEPIASAEAKKIIRIGGWA